MTDDEDAAIRARMLKSMEPEAPEVIALRKRTSARCRHVKRSLRSGKPLKGDLLDFAIEVAGGHEEIIEKLKAGQQLGDYEMHLMVDVFLLHTRLGARPSPLRER